MSNQDELQDIQITPAVAAFIDALDLAYPARCIARGEDVITAHRYAAVREFIDELVAMKQDYLEGVEDEDSRDDEG